MGALPPEIVCQIFEYLSLDDVIRRSRVSRLSYDCSREFIWEKPRFVKKISLNKLVAMEHLPVKVLRTGDVLDFEKGVNPVSLVLPSSSVRMKKLLVLHHFGRLTIDEQDLM